MTQDRGQMTQGQGQLTQDRGQMTQGQGQLTQDRRQGHNNEDNTDNICFCADEHVSGGINNWRFSVVRNVQLRQSLVDDGITGRRSYYNRTRWRTRHCK